MRPNTVGSLLIIGLVNSYVLLHGANSISPTKIYPELVSPYHPYELILNSFSPAPNRPAGVLLHVRINGGRPLRMVLDSGAESLVIGAKAAHGLGLCSGSGMDLVGLGTRPARVGMAERVEVGPVSFRNCRVAIVEGKVLEGADGVVPLALFSDFLIRLDLPRKTLGLKPYAGERDPVLPSRGKTSESGFLLVGALLNRKYEGYVVLDTGAFCSAISREIANSLGNIPMLDMRIGAGTGAATGQSVSRTVHFEVAGQDLVPSDVVALDLLNLSQHYGVEVVGVLGFPALRRYVLSIDYRNQRVTLGTKGTPSLLEQTQVERGVPHAQLATR